MCGVSTPKTGAAFRGVHAAPTYRESISSRPTGLSRQARTPRFKTLRPFPFEPPTQGAAMHISTGRRIVPGSERYAVHGAEAVGAATQDERFEVAVRLRIWARRAVWWTVALTLTSCPHSTGDSSAQRTPSAVVPTRRHRQAHGVRTGISTRGGRIKRRAPQHRDLGHRRHAWCSARREAAPARRLRCGPDRDACTGRGSPIGSQLLHLRGGWKKPLADTSAATFDPQFIRHRRVMNCVQAAPVDRSLA